MAVVGGDSGGRSEIVFVNTHKSKLGAGPWLHAEVRRHLDRSDFDVVAVCAEQSPGVQSPMLEVVSTIEDDLEILETDFGADSYDEGHDGPSLDKNRSFAAKLRAVRKTLGLALKLRRRQPAIIYSDERPRDAAAAVLLARFCGAKSVVHMHDTYGGWTSPLLKWALGKADAIVAVSHFVAGTLIAGGHDFSRIHVVLDAVEPSQWSPGRDRAAVRHELQIPEHAPTIVTVCRLAPGRGTDTLISTLPQVRERFPDVQLLVVGDEPQPGYADHLRTIAEEVGVLDCVHFTGWRTDVPRLLGACDLFVLPSVREPFGIAFLEAMASGLAVIGLRSGGVPEFVEDGVTGLIVEPGNGAGLTNAICSVLGDGKKRADMGAAGRQLVSEYFCSRRLARDIERCLHALLGVVDLRIDAWDAARVDVRAEPSTAPARERQRVPVGV